MCARHVCALCAENVRGRLSFAEAPRHFFLHKHAASPSSHSSQPFRVRYLYWIRARGIMIFKRSCSSCWFQLLKNEPVFCAGSNLFAGRWRACRRGGASADAGVCRSSRTRRPASVKWYEGTPGQWRHRLCATPGEATRRHRGRMCDIRDAGSMT